MSRIAVSQRWHGYWRLLREVPGPGIFRTFFCACACAGVLRRLLRCMRRAFNGAEAGPCMRLIVTSCEVAPLGEHAEAWGRLALLSGACKLSSLKGRQRCGC